MSTTSRTDGAATHEVINQPPPLVDHNAFEADVALGEALVREGGEWGLDRVRDFGATVASAEALDHAKRAQRNIPVLKTHDRYGNRVDEIDYDPSMHWMLRLGVEREINSLPWREPRPGAHVVRAGMFHLFNQLDTANKTWKEYAQDLGGGTGPSGGTTLQAPVAHQDAGAGSTYNAAECGAPDAGIAKAPDQAGSYTSPSTGSA